MTDKVLTMTSRILTLKCGFQRSGGGRNGEVCLKLLTGTAVGGWRPGQSPAQPYSMPEILADFAVGNVTVGFDEKVPADWGPAASMTSISRDAAVGFIARVKWTTRALSIIDARRVAGIEPTLLFKKAGRGCTVTLITSPEFLSQEN